MLAVGANHCCVAALLAASSARCLNAPESDSSPFKPSPVQASEAFPDPPFDTFATRFPGLSTVPPNLPVTQPSAHLRSWALAQETWLDAEGTSSALRAALRAQPGCLAPALCQMMNPTLGEGAIPAGTRLASLTSSLFVERTLDRFSWSPALYSAGVVAAVAGPAAAFVRGPQPDQHRWPGRHGVQRRRQDHPPHHRPLDAVRLCLSLRSRPGMAFPTNHRPP